MESEEDDVMKTLAGVVEVKEEYPDGSALMPADVKLRCLKQCFKAKNGSSTTTGGVGGGSASSADHPPYATMAHNSNNNNTNSSSCLNNLVPPPTPTTPSSMLVHANATSPEMMASGGEVEAGAHECRICGKRYGTESDLKRHFDTVHSSERRYYCTICKTGFTRHEHLKRHVFRHYDERPYKCEYCPKSFSRNEYRKRHEMIHSGEKPLQCKVCDSRFYRKDHLAKHHQRMHK